MVNVTFVLASGARLPVEIDEGESAREAALYNDVPGIDGDCGGACACATCHVHVDPAWIDRVGRLPPDSMEGQLLQFAEGATANSRLACQIRMTDRLNGLILHVPEQQY
ncbi:2Fe-2S iron-sulfur cluster-binding protein [Sphingobium cloacae]|uniref:2Fe-2S ferredoxin n=1 Tax=Sphingobium cloacae TaxID=120107 RepID=A0A1E1F7T2_9SPHN|nr:2Fe-2S iron-sulfur cluster-binding protein [Sphingobium cloacae]BAV66588.1 2Fe-2S ferredoxin [Sphingobium cloacae]